MARITTCHRRLFGYTKGNYFFSLSKKKIKTAYYIAPMKYILSIAAIVFFSSCNYHYEKLSTREFQPIPRSQVVMYLDKDQLPKNSENIGVIMAKTNNKRRAIRKAKKYAAAHGANGIYWQSKSDISRGEKVMNSLLATGFKGEYTLIAIYAPN
jgi:hypothetical protein